MLSIPGPLASFERMAGLSQQAAPEDVLPLLARNVMIAFTPEGKPTIYLTLLRRYVQQARELTTFAGPGAVIRIQECNSARALISILGYRFREACGSKAVLEVSDAERAFLTVDSGFPVADLEDALRSGKPFIYPFAASQLPVLFTTSDWMALAGGEKAANLVDLMLGDGTVARLYWALSRVDSETRIALKRSPGLDKLLSVAVPLDFYGGQISIRGGRVIVPGGKAAEHGWEQLVGTRVGSPGEFVTTLLTKDGGGLAAYYDAASRVHRAQQAYFSSETRLRGFYDAFRRADKFLSLSKSTFVPYPGLLILMTRTEIDANGRLRVPGSVAAWRGIVSRAGARGRAGVESPERWTDPDQVLQAMIAYSRMFPIEGLLPAYLALTEIDRGRPAGQRMSTRTAELLAGNFRRLGSQYSVFCEFSALDDESIGHFLNVAQALERIRSRELRADALGIFQASVGLWQILARQGEIRTGNWNNSWQKMLAPFTAVASSTQLFDAGHASLQELMRAAAGRTDVPYGEFIALLAGPRQESREGREINQYLAERIRAVMRDQQLISFDRLFAIGEGLAKKAQGQPASGLAIQLAEGLPGFEAPRSLLTNGERIQFFSGPFNDRHSAMEMKTGILKVLKSQAALPKTILAARGELSLFLRDTLVGLNYAYYEPPGSQMLHDNPWFVRSHDFSPDNGFGNNMDWETPQLSGKGRTSVGTARLVGSLADLPYVLADVEQNFLVPQASQALIWEALVPSLLTSATVPRWWAVSRDELHAVALYQRAGEELLGAAAKDPSLCESVMDVLGERMLPRRSEKLENALRAGRLEEALETAMPAENFYLAAEFRKRFSDKRGLWGPAGQELEALARTQPNAVNLRRLAEDFGVPHPGLTRSYARDLVNAEVFPAFSGYSSQLLAESWESGNLYWARLADELGYSPVELNRIVPQLTLKMAEQISASHFEDWPALVRAMKATGEEFRRTKVKVLQTKEEAPSGVATQ